ncbi:2,3-dimethylmalate lyase [Fulvia fulva]|uniref:2,3-dimethylmalate lyase n=1 Tax=Passalora fulva TaxID=5499 RepID=A0A9Q8PI67_PASFU|nr:2,3-dimethylmalate lyase [Fulvia fulva]KAK4626551.1 2,3-dimethylmalate lyase [Fulvia fulva]KAK4628155.1 2,3-dimethylmalate lyase [Fulvia fulva]UJO22908.1 2,3-dimethylmalate lyase [Fulvia fulva]WPV13098.1 2,3-dimethylmalate lyase [Fulvia fulva]WPV28237.1 2,3-dimethylmalate lyase [Fulvia fulva]
MSTNGQASKPAGVQRLREMLSDPSKTVVGPGVYDGITARLALAAGFECLYMTGAGTSMSRLGMADLGLATFNDMHQNAAMIASINPSVPVIADADTGYGGPINIARTVQAYARAGVAGLHIEDQVQEKRCGHLSGKLLVSREVYFNRLRAACRARDESRDDTLIIARTDARAGKDTEGNGGFDEAIERLKGAADIGVDALFFEAIQDLDEAKEVIKRLPNIPVLLNMVQGGRTPQVSNDEANKMGFRIVIWPCLGMEAVVPAFTKSLEALKTTGQPPSDQKMGPRALFETCGLKDLMAFDESVGGQAYQ